MKCRNWYYILSISVVFVCMSINIGLAEEKSWSYGGVEYKLPKPLTDVSLPDGIPEYHTVISGDCLWSISGHYLNDSFLWPLIWEENLDTINNPHLIFPDTQVKLPGGTLIAAGGEKKSSSSGTSAIESEEEPSEEDVVPVFRPKRKEQGAYPVTTETAIIASGFISFEDYSGPEIIGAETESFDLSTRDIVILGSGSSKGMVAEQSFFVIRKAHKVHHPVTRKYLGRMYHVMAEAKTLCINEDISTAVITRSYHPVLRGDFLVPREEVPIPVTLGSPPSDPCNPSTKKFPGYIVDAFNGGPQFSDAVILGKGDIGYIDLGSKDGVAPGDYFTIFKRNFDDPKMPRYVSGEAMIVKVAETTSVIVLTKSNTGIFLGDQIELKQ